MKESMNTKKSVNAQQLSKKRSTCPKDDSIAKSKRFEATKQKASSKPVLCRLQINERSAKTILFENHVTKGTMDAKQSINAQQPSIKRSACPKVDMIAKSKIFETTKQKIPSNASFSRLQINERSAKTILFENHVTKGTMDTKQSINAQHSAKNRSSCLMNDMIVKSKIYEATQQKAPSKPVMCRLQINERSTKTILFETHVVKETKDKKHPINAQQFSKKRSFSPLDDLLARSKVFEATKKQAPPKPLINHLQNHERSTKTNSMDTKKSGNAQQLSKKRSFWDYMFATTFEATKQQAPPKPLLSHIQTHGRSAKTSTMDTKKSVNAQQQSKKRPFCPLDDLLARSKICEATKQQTSPKPLLSYLQNHERPAKTNTIDTKQTANAQQLLKKRSFCPLDDLLARSKICEATNQPAPPKPLFSYLQNHERSANTITMDNKQSINAQEFSTQTSSCLMNDIIAKAKSNEAPNQKASLESQLTGLRINVRSTEKSFFMKHESLIFRVLDICFMILLAGLAWNVFIKFIT